MTEEARALTVDEEAELRRNLDVWSDFGELDRDTIARLLATLDAARSSAVVEPDEWWATRYAAAHRSGPEGRQASVEMSRRTNEVLGKRTVPRLELDPADAAALSSGVASPAFDADAFRNALEADTAALRSSGASPEPGLTALDARCSVCGVPIREHPDTDTCMEEEQRRREYAALPRGVAVKPELDPIDWHQVADDIEGAGRRALLASRSRADIEWFHTEVARIRAAASGGGT